MTRFRRISNIVLGVLSIIAALVVMLDRDDGYFIIMTLFSIGLVFSGLKELLYFFSMARYMVGGRISLYRGIILIDFGLFTGSLSDDSRIYIIIYLAAIHAFSGLVDVLRAFEAKKLGAGVWRLNMFHGIMDIAVAGSCFVFAKNDNVALYIYGLGRIYSACLRIASALRKSDIIYTE